MNALPEYMFISTSGSLFDTRNKEWANNPLRACYRWHYLNIDNTIKLKACLRAGEYAWPGGYRLAFVTSDGATLSYKAAEENLHNVLYSIRHNIDDGWRIVGLIDVDNCDDIVYCDHTGEQLNNV